MILYLKFDIKMKKGILVSFLMAGLSFGVFAQNAQPTQKQRPPHERKAQGNKFTPEERAEVHTKRMQASVGLSNEQYKKVLAINLEQEKQRDALRANKKAEMQANHEKMRGEHDAMRKKYESVLTPEQMTKLRAEEDKRRGEMREKKGRGGKRR